MRIDVHAHYWTDDYLDMLVELGKTDTDTQRGMGALAGRIHHYPVEPRRAGSRPPAR